MRANLLDVLNSQYIETARAKGLPEGAVIMRHAVPNALHPLVAYQGVVLPYMLTGEIEVAIVFGLATVGPAIVGSMSVGRRVGHRDLRHGARRHPHHRQHHFGRAAGAARSAYPPGRGESQLTRPNDPTPGSSIPLPPDAAAHADARRRGRGPHQSALGQQ